MGPSPSPTPRKALIECRILVTDEGLESVTGEEEPGLSELERRQKYKPIFMNGALPVGNITAIWESKLFEHQIHVEMANGHVYVVSSDMRGFMDKYEECCS